MDRKDRFILWLSDNNSKKFTNEQIVAALEDGFGYCRSHGICKESIWDISDVNRFTGISSRLLGTRIYRITHRKTAIVLDKAIPLYKEFIKNLSESEAKKANENGDETCMDSNESHVDASPEMSTAFLFTKDDSDDAIRRKLELITSILQKRYANKPAESVREVIDSNKDIPVNSIYVWAKKAENQTAAPYLFAKGILKNNIDTRSEEEKRADRIRKLTELTEVLVAKYINRPAVSLRELIEKNPELPIASINPWAKEIYGITASDYLRQKGILLPLTEEAIKGRLQEIIDQIKARLTGKQIFSISEIDSLELDAGTTVLHNWVKTLYGKTLSEYLIEENILFKQSEKTSGTNATVTANDHEAGGASQNKHGQQDIQGIDQIGTIKQKSQTPSEDSITDSDRLYIALKNESLRSKYGTTLYYLAKQAAISQEKARTILVSATWAKQQYGRYYFVPNNEQKSVKFDFYHPSSLSYTKPVSLSYFDETISTADSWRKLYVDCLKVLYEDYSHKIDPIVEVPDGKRSVPLIVRAQSVHLMRTPGEFSDGLFVELNESANTIVSRITALLELCEVDFENVVILYKYTDAELEVTKATSLPESKSGTPKAESSDAIDHQTKTESDQSEISNEVMMLLEGEEFDLLRDALSKQNITTIEKLRALKLWPFMNRYDLYSIGKRQAIFTKVNALLYQVVSIDESQAYVLHVGECEYSYKGTSPSDAFLQYCNDMFMKHPLQFKLLVGVRMRDGHGIPVRMDGVGSQFLEMAHLHAYISSDLSKEEAIRYTEWIQGKCGEKPTTITMSVPVQSTPPAIPSGHTQEKSINEEPSEVSTRYETPSLTDNKREAEIIRKIEQFILNADMRGVSYDDVKNEMHMTMVAVKRSIADALHVLDIKGRLIHEDAFIDWEEGADQLESIIEKLMQKNNGYISSAQLYEYVRADMNMFLNDNDVNDERSVYEITRHLFEKKRYHNKRFYFYNNTHISRSERAITSNLDVFRKYAADQGGVFTFDGLVDYLSGIGIGSGNLRTQMRISTEPIFFYYEPGVLMCADSMNIDAIWKSTIKKALEDLFVDVGSYMILRTIPAIWLDRLPLLPGRRPWTPLLLQSILRCYSKELGASTIPALAGQSLDTLHPMLIAENSPIQTFGDVVVSYLLDNSINKREFEAEELRRLLVDAGIIQGNELIWNMPKALNNDERFAWNASGDHVVVEANNG